MSGGWNPYPGTGSSGGINGNPIPNPLPIPFSYIGQPNGVPGLDSTAKVPISQLPSGLPSVISPPTPSVLGGLFANTPVANHFVKGYDDTGTAILVQPAFTDLTGAAVVGQIPTGTSGSTVPLCNGAIAWSGAHSFGSTVAVTGALTLAEMVQGSTGNSHYTLGGATASLLFRTSAFANLMQIGTSANQIIAFAPIVHQPLVAYTGQTWAGNAMASIIENNAFTGTVVGGVTGFFPAGFINQTFNIGVGGGAAGSLKIILANGTSGTSAFDGSLYGIDIQCSAAVLQQTGSGDEFHCLRGTTIGAANLGGGGIGGGVGYLIGLKAATQSSSAATFYRSHQSMEVLTSNAGGVDYLYGAIITDTSTLQGYTDHIGLAICMSQTGGVLGYETCLSFGSTLNGPPGSSSCTLIGGTNSSGGGAWTVAKGIDWSNGTFNSFAWKSNGSEIDGSGNGTFASVLLGSTGIGLITGTGAPSGTKPNGTLYLRQDGAANTRLYISEGGGTWAPVSSA